MGDISKELEEVRNRFANNRVAFSKLVTCNPNHVRVEISKTKVKTIVVLIHFPKCYPKESLLVELRSKSNALNDNFIQGLTAFCEEEIKKFIGEPQILRVIEFLSTFIKDNPLCCCADEISAIKKKVLKTQDEIKLKQKQSTISVKLTEEKYYHRINAIVPDNYPYEKITFETVESNFPKNMQIYFKANATEIARRCVEPPLNKKQPKNQPFEPKPSLKETIAFLVDCVHRFPHEKCHLCNSMCLSTNPDDVIVDENDDMHVERIYCNHLYHLKCLLDYMKTPPFKGGKKCLVCNQRIYHEKYKVSPELSEARWAHNEARQRELADVTEFLS